MKNSTVTLLANNIWQAVDDYRKHTDLTDVLDDISDSFVSRLAEDSFNSKSELRSLFQNSPAWNENLQALVINGSRTHNPDFNLIDSLAHKILNPVIWKSDIDMAEKINLAIRFFSRPNENFQEYIDAINSLAPKAYAPHKKKSRIFKAICDSLGVTDYSAGSDFQKIFAQFADELSTRKIDFKLFVSINPAHFLTMSNPKEDNRGSTLTSCHSFNSTEYTYNCGCSGYARDKYTFIVFTVADPSISETLNNRKTTRQIFMYKPHNGLLLQSRLYNSRGGTSGSQAESKLYRDLIQREISALESAPNLWKTFAYFDNDHDIIFHPNIGFGGYPDWIYRDFDAKISIRSDHSSDFQTFKIGTFGLCISCGDEISSGLYCDSCSPEDFEICDDCGNHCHSTTEVYNAHGDIARVCDSCLEEYYSRCYHCECFHHVDALTHIYDDIYVCPDCLDERYSLCLYCDDYYYTDEMFQAVDRFGDTVLICENCVEHYKTCDHCQRYVLESDAVKIINDDGNPLLICKHCFDNDFNSSNLDDSLQKDFADNFKTVKGGVIS